MTINNLFNIEGINHNYKTDGKGNFFSTFNSEVFPLKVNSRGKVYLKGESDKKGSYFAVEDLQVKNSNEVKGKTVLTAKAACKLLKCSNIKLIQLAKNEDGVKKLARNEYILCDNKTKPEGVLSGVEVCNKLGISSPTLKYRSDNKLGVVKVARNQYKLLQTNPEGKTAKQLAKSLGVTQASIYNYVRKGLVEKVGMKKYILKTL